MRRTKVAGLGVALSVVVLAMAGGTAGARDYKTGGTPTPPELRQSIPAAPVYRDFLPQAVDLSRYMPPVGDQGNQGSCVGWATAYAARAYYAQQVEHRDISLKQNIPSPAWIFDIIHIGKTCDEGSYIPDALNVLTKGAYSLAEFPYDDTKCPRPLPPARLKATDFRIDGFDRVWDIQQSTDLDQVKGALAKGNPVVILASLDKAFFDLSPRNKVWVSDTSKKDEGGHAITLVGYDDASQTFKFINQWSTEWGDKGYGRMTYDTFKSRVYEGYTMRLPGDPEVSLTDADFTTDATPPQPSTPVFVPPLNVRPTEASRDLGDAPIDVGALSCGHVDIITDAEGNRIASGFVGTQKELSQVAKAVDGKVDDNQVSLAPWPACEVRMTLLGQLADTDLPQAVVDPEAPKVGDDMRVGLQTPGFASYLYATWFSADGTVNTLTQPTSLALKPRPAHSQIKFGEMDAGEIGLKVKPPVGSEMLLVVASEKPLFDAALPEVQTDRQFLSSLREAVLKGDAGRVTATLLPVTTSE